MNWLFSIFIITSSILVSVASADITVKKRNILLVFPQFENLGLTDRRVVAGINLAYNNNNWIKSHFNLIESKTTPNIPDLIKQTIEDVKKYKPIIIIGAVTSNTAFAISEVAESEKIPFISPFATNPKLTASKQYTFTTCFDDDFQASTLAQYIFHSGSRNGAILVNQGSTYALGFAETFSSSFVKHGGKITTLNFTTAADADLEQIFNLKKQDLDFILIPSYQIEAANIISRLYSKLRDSVKYFGGDSWGGGSVFYNAIKEISGPFHGHYVQHWSQDSQHPENLAFLKSLKSITLESQLRGSSTAMNAPIAMGYDAALTAFQTLKLSKTNAPDDLVIALRKINIVGASGPIRYQSGRNSPQKGLFIYQLSKQSELLVKFVPSKGTK